MKQNTLWFFTAVILATFALMGAPYMIPYLDIQELNKLPIEIDLDWTTINSRLTDDTGLELFFPMFSLVFFFICAVIFAATKRFRLLIFILALINILFAISIPSILNYSVEMPHYKLDNGYYLHLASSILLLILGIRNLKPSDRVFKMKSKNDPSLLDEIV